MAEWTNYGDISPLEHGGKWVAEDGERSYRVVEIVSHPAKDETWLVYDMFIDLADEWINEQAVKECAGTTDEEHDDINYLLDCITHYGGESFDAQPYEIEGKENMIADLKLFGIEI